MSVCKCRFCGGRLDHTLIDLGLSPISNEYIREEQLDQGQFFYPLKVSICENCFLAQVQEYEKPENIFHDYKYFSSFSSGWLRHCREYVDMIVPRLGLSGDSMVYELACNDGYLLQYFLPYGIPVCGIEPAGNVAAKAREKGIRVETCFWGEQTAGQIAEQYGPADLIIGNNVLAHVPDINGFVEGIHKALKAKGTVTMEFPHLLRLLQKNQFDTVYHEHFSYFSLFTADKIFETHGLKIYDVQELPTHGGSLRIYAAHAGNADVKMSHTVHEILMEEKEYGLCSMDGYRSFSDRVRKIKRDATALLASLKEKGASIAAFAAAAKGNTFLNYCGIGTEYIDFVADSSSEKQGLYLPGTRIPIVSPEMIREKKPDYIILLAWNIREELAGLLEDTREWGCKFITFIPETEVF